MNSYRKVSKQIDFQEPASNLKNKNTTSTFQLVDNRVSTSAAIKDNNISARQLKSNQAIASFNSNVAQLAKFNNKQRAKKLAANKKKYKGFHTCAHCGFQHSLIHYATLKGKRMGDGQFHIDHIQPASKGGKNNMRNGRVYCGTCNTSRGNRAYVGRTGIDKYRALHGKKVAKDYKRKPNR